MRRTFIIIIISKFTAVNGNYHGNGKTYNFSKKNNFLICCIEQKYESGIQTS